MYHAVTFQENGTSSCTIFDFSPTWRTPFLVSVLLYVHRNHQAYYGRGAQDGHLDIHTAPELCDLLDDDEEEEEEEEDVELNVLGCWMT